MNLCLKIPSGGGSVEDTFHLGLGVVYNVLVEVKRGVVQGLAVFRHAEFISASQFVILRCQRHSPIRCWYNFKASLRVAKNLCKYEILRSKDLRMTKNASLRGAKRRDNPGKLTKSWIAHYVRNDRKSYPLPLREGIKGRGVLGVVSASQLTSLRRVFCKILSLPSILRNLNTTLSLTLSLGEGTKLNSLAPCGRGKNFNASFYEH